MAPPQIFRGTAQLRDQIPLTPRNDSVQYTPKFAIRSVGPIELKAGDRVLVTAREQLDNENRDAGADWAEPVVQDIRKTGSGKQNKKTKTVTAWPTYAAMKVSLNVDPRWTLWVGNNIGVIRASTWSGTDGETVIRETGENWDNWIHHWRYTDAGWDLVDQDELAYYVTTCWLDTNPAYRLSGQSIKVTPRGSLEAAVYR
jgi:hypothetical protein